MLPALTGPCSINSPASAVTPFHVDDPFLTCGASFITTVDFPDQRKSSSSPLPPSSSSSPSPNEISGCDPANARLPESRPKPRQPTSIVPNIELGDLGFGRGIHGDALKFGCSSNGFMGSSLMGLYSRCGFVKDATEVLDEITEKDIVVYTSIITGYGQIYKRLAYSISLQFIITNSSFNFSFQFIIALSQSHNTHSIRLRYLCLAILLFLIT
ncbi:hypothetical protein COP1_023817 [Malus domestica]